MSMLAVSGALAILGTAASAGEPKFAADVPASITTPDAVETRIGTLRFSDGAPDAETVRKVYDELDFCRGIEAFLTGMSSTSVYAICDGLEQAGIRTNHGLGITADLMDARSMFLTANTTTVYVTACLGLGDGPRRRCCGPPTTATSAG